MSDKKEYPVGYKKPPKHTQFKKGESGRSRARASSRTPRIKRTLHEVIRRVAARITKVREGDAVREERISDLIVEKALMDAIRTKNPRHMQYILTLLDEADAFGDRPMTEEENFADFIQNASPEDLRAAGDIAAELARYLPPDGEGEPDDWPKDED